MPDIVYLRINRRLLLLPNPPTQNQPNPPSSQPFLGETSNLNIIAGRLRDIQTFSGPTVDWLIHVARLILDPRGAGILYTFQTETVQYWLNRELAGSWRQVAAGEQLQPTIYEYRRLDGQPMDLTRICDCQIDSMSTRHTREEAEFRNAIPTQHIECIISRASYDRTLTSSHLIPACLGDAGVQYIFERFTGLSNPVTRHHQSITIPLNLFLDAFVASFELGFWNTGDVCISSLCTLPCIDMVQNQYEVHVFIPHELNINGLQRGPNDPHLHRYVISVRTDPPSGVFAWHYVQCVLRRFGTEEYRAVNNIVHFAFEFPPTDDEPELDCFFGE